MANSYVNEASEAQTGHDYRAWVIGLGITALLMVGVGLGLALMTGGIALPWVGMGLGVALALAAIVGVSKTSSA